MPLSAVELRVLGALVEKALTTPDAYPMSIHALVNACNQKTSRHPVTDYHLQEVQEALARLRDRSLAATVHGPADRVPKHSHRLGDALELDVPELALLSVLMLRGEQTPGELRARTGRSAEFADIAAVEAALARLAARSTPLVRNRGRAPGKSQDRWEHTLGADEERLQPRVRAVRAGPEEPAIDARFDALDARLDVLDARIEALEEEAARRG